MNDRKTNGANDDRFAVRPPPVTASVSLPNFADPLRRLRRRKGDHELAPRQQGRLAWVPYVFRNGKWVLALPRKAREILYTDGLPNLPLSSEITASSPGLSSPFSLAVRGIHEFHD